LFELGAEKGVNLRVPPRLAPTLLLALPALAMAQTDGPRLSVRPHEAIIRTLPPFEPKLARSKTNTMPDTPPDPDVVVLPEVVVEEQPLPKFTPGELLTTKGRAERLLAQRSSPLDRALNRFTIPIIGISPEQRVNWEYNINHAWQRRYEIHDLEKAGKAHHKDRPPGG